MLLSSPARLAVLALAPLMTGCLLFPHRVQFERVIERDFDQPLGAIEARLSSEDLTVTGRAAPGAHLQVQIIARAPTQERAEALARGVEASLPVRVEGAALRIDQLPRAWRNWWNGEDVSVHYRVAIAAGSAVDVEGSSSDVRVRAIHGGVSVTTSSGDVEIEQASAEVKVESSSGDVRLVNVQGAVAARTLSGNVRIRQHAGARAQVQTASGDVELKDTRGELVVNTASGDVEVQQQAGARAEIGTTSGSVLLHDLAGDLSVRTSSGDVVVDSKVGRAARWNIGTLSGDVQVGFAGRPSFTLSVATQSGGIDSELPISISGRMRENRLEGVVGPAPEARTVAIDTSSGDVQVRLNARE